MLVEFNMLVDLYDTPDESGKSKLIKKDILYKKIFDTATSTCEHCISEKGKILKGYANIITNGQTFKVKHSYEEVRAKLQPITVKGFIAHAKKTKYKS